MSLSYNQGNSDKSDNMMGNKSTIQKELSYGTKKLYVLIIIRIIENQRDFENGG